MRQSRPCAVGYIGSREPARERARITSLVTVLGRATCAVTWCVGILLALPASAAVAQDFCPGDLSGNGVEQLPAPPLRFGINPAGEAGAAGPAVPVTAIDQGKTFEALERLRPAGESFPLRLNRFFWSLHQDGIDRFERLANLYTRHGYPVELQLRYHPTERQEGRIHRW